VIAAGVRGGIPTASSFEQNQGLRPDLFLQKQPNREAAISAPEFPVIFQKIPC
jgi:hypothetical protein